MKNQQSRPIQPLVCRVGDRAKIIYPTELEAEVAARNAEIDHGLPINSLTHYQCEYAPHFHLTRVKAGLNHPKTLDNREF
jgi:hypothetical protein